MDAYISDTSEETSLLSTPETENSIQSSDYGTHRDTKAWLKRHRLNEQMAEMVQPLTGGELSEKLLHYLHFLSDLTEHHGWTIQHHSQGSLSLYGAVVAYLRRPGSPQITPEQLRDKVKALLLQLLRKENLTPVLRRFLMPEPCMNCCSILTQAFIITL